MRVMVKLVFSASISSNACRSYPMLPGRRRWTLFSRTPCPFSDPRFLSAAAAARPFRTPSLRSVRYSLRALNAATQRPNVASLMPSSRATVATALPVVTTSFTASSLYSGVKSRRDLAIVNILSCEVSTQRGQGYHDPIDFARNELRRASLLGADVM